MVLPWEPAALLNVVSGVLMGVLGGALLLSRPKEDWNRLFGLLAVFWGVQIVAANAVRLTDDPAVALLAGKLTLAFLVPLYFFVVSFVAVFPEPRAPFGTSPLAIAVLALPAAGALVVLFLAPELLLAGVARTDAGLTLDWGPLLPYLVTAPFYGSLSYAVYVMMERLDEARSRTETHQVAMVLGALGLFTAYYAPRQLVLFGGDALGLGQADEAAGLETWLIAAVMLATVAVLVAVVVGLVRRLREGPPAVRDPARTALGLVGLGLASAAVVEALAAAGGPALDLLGVLRSGSVAIVVYAIARYQLFDLELRAKRWTAAGAGVLAAAGVAAAAFAGLQTLELSTVANATATTLVAALALLPALHASFRLADRIAPGVESESERLYLRKLEVYRAAVDRKRGADGAVDPRDRDLVALRERLDLEERDHGVVATLGQPGAGTDGDQLDVGQEVFGKYELEEVIAEGGFGRVLRARDTMLGRRVVVKELLARWREDEAIAERFLQEARIAGQLDHPNVVSVYGIEEHGGDRFLVMEYVPGGTLADRLEAGPLDPDEAVRATRQVLAALSAAHERGVVHRDVKPDNVLFDAEDRVKLADFGVARLTRDGGDDTVAGLESPGGSQPGTVAYMSPEQAAGETVDERSDVYGAGALLYRCLAGEPPVDVAGLDAFSARQRVAEASEPDLSDVPGHVRATLERALAPDPEERFPTASAFRRALENAPVGGEARARDPAEAAE